VLETLDAERADSFVLRQMDFLVKSHVYERLAPHPFPAEFGRDTQPLEAYTFAWYGEWG
jgi:hypothetical protein